MFNVKLIKFYNIFKIIWIHHIKYYIELLILKWIYETINNYLKIN